MSKKVKIFAGIILGLALLIFGASLFSGSPKADQSSNVRSGATTGGTLSTTAETIPGGPMMTVTPGQMSAGANEFSGLLSSISTISIDTTIFQSAAYKALRDYPVLLGTDIIGRINPFAPVGNDAGPSAIATVEVQTLAPGKIATMSAEFGAMVTLPDTAPATVVFQYGPTDTFGNTTSPVSVTKTGATLTTVTGLTPGTKYFVQAAAVRGSNTTIGNIMTFTTTGGTVAR